MTGQIRLGVVGLGMAAAPHAQSLLDLRGRVEVAGAFSPSPDRRRAFTERYGFPEAESLDAILSDPSVDGLIVLTPPSTHLEIVRAAAVAGKHILLEKPLEITLKRSEALVEAAEKAGVRLAVVLQNRFRRTILQVGDMVRDGQLGELVSVSLRLSNWRPQSYYDEPGRGTLARDGGGITADAGHSRAGQMIALTGLPQEVSGYVATSTPDGNRGCRPSALRFANGAIGAVSATTAAIGFPTASGSFIPGHRSVSSTGGEIRFLEGAEQSIKDDGQGSGTGASPMAFTHHHHRAALADFVDAVTGDREPKISGREALKVHRLIDAITRSSESGARVHL